MRLPLGILALLISACLVGAPTVHAQAAAEYGGAAGVSAGAVASKPDTINPGPGPAPHDSLCMHKTAVTPRCKLAPGCRPQAAGPHGEAPPAPSVADDDDF